MLVNKPPKKLGSWAPVDSLSKSTQEHAAAIAHLKDGGLEGEHILWTWVECRVIPLRAREAPMYTYSGREDPMRVSDIELGPVEV